MAEEYESLRQAGDKKASEIFICTYSKKDQGFSNHQGFLGKFCSLHLPCPPILTPVDYLCGSSGDRFPGSGTDEDRPSGIFMATPL